MESNGTAGPTRVEVLRANLERLAWRSVVEVVDRLGPFARRLGVVTAALVLAALVYVAVRVWPLYVHHYALKDKVTEIARSQAPPDLLGQRLMRAVSEEGLQEFIGPGDFQVLTERGSRRIRCEYEVPLRLLPGLIRRIRLLIHVEQPVIFEPDPVLL